MPEEGIDIEREAFWECFVGREKWVIAAAFLGGILLANLMDRQLLVTYGILNDYFLSRYTSQSIDSGQLFCYVWMERCKAAVFVVLLGHAVHRRVLPAVLWGFVAASFGFLTVVAIYNLGMAGIVICLCGLFPQWLFYLAAMAVYLDGRRENLAGGIRQELPASLFCGFLEILLLMLGIFAESYLNPILITYLLKIF